MERWAGQRAGSKQRRQVALLMTCVQTFREWLGGVSLVVNKGGVLKDVVYRECSLRKSYTYKKKLRN